MYHNKLEHQNHVRVPKDAPRACKVLGAAPPLQKWSLFLASDSGSKRPCSACSRCRRRGLHGLSCCGGRGYLRSCTRLRMPPPRNRREWSRHLRPTTWPFCASHRGCQVPEPLALPRLLLEALSLRKSRSLDSCTTLELNIL